MTLIDWLIIGLCVVLTSGEIWLTMRRNRHWIYESVREFPFEIPLLIILMLLAPMGWVLDILYEMTAYDLSDHRYIWLTVGALISGYFTYRNIVAGS